MSSATTCPAPRARVPFIYLFLAIFFALALGSGAFVGPRIWRTPLPESEARFHQHAGDGFTEIGIIYAHNFWQRHGYAATAYLPMIEPAGDNPAEWQPYTHYPPGAYLLSSLALHFFRYNPAHPEIGLQRVRLFFYFLTLMTAAIALCLFSMHSPYPLGIGIALGLVLGACRGFYLFADNLFCLGLVLTLQGCLAAVLFHFQGMPRKLGVWYATLAAVSFCFSVELIPFVFLAPGLLLLSQSISKRTKHLSITCALAGAVFAFTSVAALRITQNALWYGSAQAVFDDWQKIIASRIGGFNTSPASVTSHTNFVFEFGSYFAQMLHYQKMNLTRYGFFAMLGAAFFPLLCRRWYPFGIFCCVTLVTMSWNTTFLQHSYMHLYTVRYIVWCLLLSLYIFADSALNLILGSYGVSKLLRVKSMLRL